MPVDLYSKFIVKGFERIERDDRMLDIFPNETREKGIELWNKWNEETVEIIRLHLPSGEKGITRHVFSCKEVETALEENKTMQLL